MLYLYTRPNPEPNLDFIHSSVENSTMSNKTIEWCRWDEKTSELRIVFTLPLSSEDKAILDNIILGA